MSSKIIQFPYSKKSGYAGLTVLVVFILFLSKTTITNYLAHDIWGTIIFGAFILFALFLLGVLIISRLIPAFKGEVALELDENGVKDYVRNLMLDWQDIDDIGLKPGRSAAMLIFDLKFDSDFGKQVSISLRWIEGRDREIYEKVLDYFDTIEGIERLYEDSAE